MLQSSLAPVLTVQQGECSCSEELEGGSPSSERSICLQLSGAYAHRVVPPPRKGLRWVVRQLRRQRPDEATDPSLVSGSSYDSLCSLDEQGCVDAPAPVLQQHPNQQLSQPEWPQADTLQQYPHSQQQQHPVCQQQDTQPQASSTSEASSSSSPDGLLRRAVKAVLRPMVRAVVACARAVASSAGPQGPGNNDNSMAERVVNVLTSLPFFAVGLHGLRNRRCPKGRHFALSFMMLGAVASSYHGADRSSWLRPIMRKLDYYTICYTSTVLRSAAHIPLPTAAKAAALLVAPFKPSIVTGLNLALVEGKFLKHALAHSHLRSSFQAHIGTAAVGMVCFAYEDVATGAGWPPVLHSLWHCLSAAAMGCLHGLLQHLELAVLVEGMQLEAAGSS